MRGKLDDLKKALADFVMQHTPTVAGTGEVDTQPTLGFQRVIQRAILHVQSSGKKEVTGANVLVAIYGEKDSHAVYFLHQQGVSRLDVVNFISHGITKNPQAGAAARRARGEPEGQEAPGAGGALESFTQNLNQLAADGKIDPLIGRAAELERVIQILCRRRKNNPLLVGEAGVGKTAIAEGLAKRIIDGNVPEVLAEGAGVRARHGRAPRRHQVSRRLRAEAEGGAQAARREPERDPLHRRDPHPHRRGQRLRRHAGRLEPAEARAFARARSSASAPPPTRSTAASSRRTTPSRGASRRST